MLENEASKVNVPLLRKAVEWAEAEAAKPPQLCEWNQNDTVVAPAEFHRYFGAEAKDPSCGTCFCIAGYVATTYVDPRYAENSFVNDVHLIAAAERAIGVPTGSWFRGDVRLFDGGNTIADVRRIAEDLAGERL